MRSRLAGFSFATIAVLTTLCAMSSSAFATPGIVPEIDANSMVAGLGLLGAGVMMLRARRR